MWRTGGAQIGGERTAHSQREAADRTPLGSNTRGVTAAARQQQALREQRVLLLHGAGAGAGAGAGQSVRAT